MIRLLEKKPILTIIVIVAIMLFASFPYLEVSIMEARNFITAREMLTDGNWILTTMNGEPRYQKPPLPTWLAAISASLFGIKNILALRLPGILMVMTIGITCYIFSKNLLSKSNALVNALIMITSFYVVAIVVEAPWDIFTHGFMFIAIYYLFQLLRDESDNWRFAFLSGLFIGLSILCKGPISFYALLLPFLIAFGIVYKYKNLKSKITPLLGLIILALLVGGWWYLYVRLNDPDTFMEIANKETANWSSYNVRPFYYYWSFFTQSGIWTIPAFISLLYPYMKSRVSHEKAYRLTFFWTISAVILLSIIPEKKSRYLMPVLIPLALNTGFYIDYLIRRFRELKGKETFPVYFHFGLVGIMALFFGVIGYVILKDFANINWVLFATTSLVLFVIGLSLILKIKSRKIKSVFYLVILFVVAAFALVGPLSKGLKSENYNSISTLAEEVKGDSLEMYHLGAISPEMIWDYGNKIPQIQLKDANFIFPKENQFGLLADKLSPEQERVIKEIYSIKVIDTFDLNTVEPKARQYKNRLKSVFYVLSKK